MNPFKAVASSSLAPPRTVTTSSSSSIASRIKSKVTRHCCNLSGSTNSLTLMYHVIFSSCHTLLPSKDLKCPSEKMKKVFLKNQLEKMLRMGTVFLDLTAAYDTI